MLVSWMKDSAFHRVDAFFLDEVTLAAYWSEPFRPLLGKMHQLLDAFRERHSMNDMCLLQPSVVIQTAAATVHTVAVISDYMHLAPSRTIIRTPDRPELQVKTQVCTRYVQSRRIGDLVATFIATRGSDERMLILAEGKISSMQALRKALEEKINPSSLLSIKEPVRLAFSGDGCPNSEFEMREFQRERMCSDIVPSCRILIMPSMYGGIGFDVPGISVVVHVGPPKNVELAYQFIGRCRGTGVGIFLLTWSQRCNNIFRIVKAISAKESSERAVAFNNGQRSEANRIAAILFYPEKCIRQEMEESFIPRGPESCKTCRHLGVPLCSGCFQDEKKSLLAYFKDEFLPAWNASHENKIEKAMVEMDWDAIVNDRDYEKLKSLHNNALADFLIQQGVTPTGTSKDKRAKDVHTLCCPERFDEFKMIRIVRGLFGNGEKIGMEGLVTQIVQKATVSGQQAQEVVQRLLVHRFLDDEPPANVADVAQATSVAGLKLWRVGAGPKFRLRKVPPLQVKQRTLQKISARQSKKQKQQKQKEAESYAAKKKKGGKKKKKVKSSKKKK